MTRFLGSRDICRGRSRLVGPDGAEPPDSRVRDGEERPQTRSEFPADLADVVVDEAEHTDAALAQRVFTTLLVPDHLSRRPAVPRFEVLGLPVEFERDRRLLV